MYSYFLFHAAPSLGAFNSPTLGSRVSIAVGVASADANGEVGFASTQTLSVNEPVGSSTPVRLFPLIDYIENLY